MENLLDWIAIIISIASIAYSYYTNKISYTFELKKYLDSIKPKFKFNAWTSLGREKTNSFTLINEGAYAKICKIEILNPKDNFKLEYNNTHPIDIDNNESKTFFMKPFDSEVAKKRYVEIKFSYEDEGGNSYETIMKGETTGVLIFNEPELVKLKKIRLPKGS
jgi:hypothetical protein